MQHPAVYTLLWTAGILAVFVPLSTRQYRRAASSPTRAVEHTAG